MRLRPGDPTQKTLTILFIEDNLDHAELVKRSFEGIEIANRIHHVEDGEAALDYLFRRGRFADPATSPRPHVILLDLRLPKVDGLEVLRVMRETEHLQKMPVVVLTTSHADLDVARAYENFVNSYLVKPTDFEKFCQLMKDLGSYWLTWNYYPWSQEEAPVFPPIFADGGRKGRA